jgi:DNA (cytosine-5)-methyltransferase 1
MFSGIGGFREGLTRAGGFECVGHCEIDKYANRSYNALFDTKGEWFIEDARKADPGTMPDFQLLCGGFPCQTFSIAGTRKGFGDPRGTLFFELARLAEARKPPYLLFENVVGLINHDHCRTFATILNTLDRLGYGVEWQCLNSKDFGVPQSRNRVYIIGYLDERCRGKVFPFTETAGSSLIQTHGGHQGERVYSPEGLSCTLAANPGGFGGKTGLYEVGVPIKCATKTGYQMAQVGDSIDLSYATVNSRRGRVGKEIAHTLTTGCQQGTVEVRPVKNPIKSDLARNTERTGKPGAPMHTLTTKDRHGVLCEGRIRRLTPRECLRLQGWADDRIDTDVSNVTNFSRTFEGCSLLAVVISNWNVSNATTMNSMFKGASAFNQSLSIWNTSKVTDMNYMFQNATVFNQNISGWNVAAVVTKPPTNFSTGSALTNVNKPGGWTT